MGLRVKVVSFVILFTAGIFNIVNSQSSTPPSEERQWIDRILTSMSVDQKIGQLMMIATYSNQNESHYENVELLIERYHIGGLVFFQGSPTRQAELTNRYQQSAEIPLLIGMDAEWGAGMRLDSIIPLPKQMTLGGIDDNRLIYNYASEIARQCKQLGVHVNFAPVLDVNNNASNPVINMRSFGEDPEVVAQKGIAYLHGLQDNGIIAVGKHFPGHGDTDMDSHLALPVIRNSLSQLDSIEMIPFKKSVVEGIEGIMVAHLSLPALEADPNRPASLSENVVNRKLRLEYDFNGLVFTDAMNMRGVTSIFPSGKAELEAFKAGCDVLLMPVSVPAVLETFKSALEKGEISENMIDKKVARILKAKYKAGLYQKKSVNTQSVVQKLNRHTESVSRSIFEHAITLVNNQDHLIPFHLIDTIRFASLDLNSTPELESVHHLRLFTSFDHYFLDRKSTDNEKYQEIFDDLKNYDVVVVSLHDVTTNARRNFGIYQEDIDYIHQLNKYTQVVLIVYGIPYSLKDFTDIGHLVCAYEDGPFAWSVVPQLLFGALPFKGRLPVSISQDIPSGFGVQTRSLGRLGFSTPEAEGFDVDYLEMIDSIVHESIRDKVIPGCQILIARNGRVVFNRNYGFQTYDQLIPIEENSLYDLASVTKVAGTIQALMMLYEKGLVDLDKKASFYIPYLKKSNKKDIILRDLLTHQAGLLPYYPFWLHTLKRYNSHNNYYANAKSNDYSIEVNTDLFATPALRDTLWHWMLNTELLEKEDPRKPYSYKYSDMGFYIIERLIDDITGWTLDEFLQQYLYEPLGLTYLTYLPQKKFTTDLIVPSGIDKSFRNGIIQGHVNDEIAAIYGGVAGHAGLFSNAYELSKILQMNLQGGYYGGISYFQPATIREFTQRQYKKNRRGIGWDKPQIIGDEYNPASFYASGESYGHSGFTGTFVWVDPKYDLLYVFLSNRTYPDVDNRKLIDQDTRKRIQTVIYSSIINRKK
jgi:beta-N-acetylhexosaminidase